MVSLWNPSDMDGAVLPPCHYGFQIYINDGKMDLMWNQRSADVFLGLPYDICMYALLLIMLCKGTEYTPGQLIGSIGDCHLYTAHLDAAKTQLKRDMRSLPQVSVDWGLSLVYNAVRLPDHSMIHLSNYAPHPSIKAKLLVAVSYTHLTLPTILRV